MEMDKKAFTITWKIKNFNFRWKEDHTFTLFSPVFNIKNDEQESSAWRMLASPSAGTKYIELLIQKLSGWLTFVSYEISFSDKNGISFMSIRASGASFSTLQGQLYHVPVITETIPPLQDMLTISLKIWDAQLPHLVPDHVFAETKIKVKKGSSVWSVHNFSDMKAGEIRAMLPRNASKDIMPISFNICIEWGIDLKIRVAKLDPNTIKHCQCNFFLLDAAGIPSVHCGKLDIITDGNVAMPEWEISLRRTIADLLQDKTRFLPEDVLSFQCDFAFSTGDISEKIVDSEVYDDSNFTEKNSERLNTLREDLKSLCIDPILYDTKLQTTTESFPAHSAILSARSPVFRAMFTTDMKEKTKECVYIEDLDASTVRRMLLFIYSDTLEDLNWESAKNLYVASDKYDITNLRHLCANFLEQNLHLSNCCDALLLAYMHQDSKLMSLVQDFMSENTKEILTSEKWKILEKEHSLLTSETLRLLLLKNLPI